MLKLTPRIFQPVALLLWFGIPAAASAKELALSTEANVMVELALTSAQTFADPFNEVSLDAVVIDPSGRELRVPAFWAGGNRWKARYASPLVGQHRFRTECSAASDTGLHGISGVIEIRPYRGKNILYQRGPLKVSGNRRFLEYDDGKPFFWLGDTWWMGLCNRLRWPEDVKTLATNRKEKGFNVIQIVAGLYPDMHPFDPRGANEGGFPWEPEYARMRPEYFDAADQRFLYLVEEGFTPCIVGVWGYFIPWMGVEKTKQHWRYLVARYGALPVVWCVAGEANLPWYLAPGFPFDDRSQVKSWTEVTRYLRALDPFHRIITIHPTGIGRLSARNAIDDISLLDFDMLQTPHSQRGAVAPTVRTMRESYADTPIMPVINGEPAYEMLNDNLPTEWSRQMFWLCMMNGAAGHTYGANGIWQVNRRGQPHGPSPYASSPPTGYGKIAWDDAMNLPGSQHMAHGRKLLERYAWQDFRPHPEWAEFSDQTPFDFSGSHWIGYPEGDLARTAQPEKRWFRRTFELPAGKPIKSAQLFVAADGSFTARINKRNAGSGKDATLCSHFYDLSNLLLPGKNVVGIVTETTAASGGNPARLIARLEVTYADGDSLKLVSDATWRGSKTAATGWDTPDFDDATWSTSRSLAAYGSAASTTVARPNNNDIFGPQSAGIPGVVRITYVPQPAAINARLLERTATYSAAYFDPVSGVKTPLGPIHTDDNGTANIPAPAQNDHDWVLVLEQKTSNPPASRANLEGDAPPSSRGRAPTAQDSATPATTAQATLSNNHLSWGLDWTNGALRSSFLENKRSGHRFSFSDVRELGLTFSTALDRVAPSTRLTDFQVRGVRWVDPTHAVFELETTALPIGIALHVQLEGPARRKWVEVSNRGDKELLLLDVDLDDFTTDASLSGGGPGAPIFLEGEAFAAIEHPAGWNTVSQNRVQLAHYPGRRLPPGASFLSKVALVAVANAGEANAQFLSHLESKGMRKNKTISVYAPLGINNQWGAAPTLDDEQTLDVLDLMEKWQKKGVRFDYFTLDAGWVDFNSDLTRFRPVAYPNGPKPIIDRVHKLGMKFGLWFATSWGPQSCWDYAPAFADGHSPGRPYREGYPLTAGGITFCFASENYYQLFKRAILHHVRENSVRFLKIDGGDYPCKDPTHGHLPGNYAIERAYDHLIDVADAARAAAPDVFVMWYWGHRSPFWALHGDTIFESGLHMEGSGTSRTPTLYYRDSVTLAQDQNARHARNIPATQKDSLGVWLADNRWGNFMGKDRWREGMVMDLGRGNLLFPNLWGNLYHLTDDDVDFLARISAIAKNNETLLSRRRNILGDPFRNEVYGYAHCQNTRGFLFLNNCYFASRPAELRLDESLGLGGKSGVPLTVVSHFPDRTRVIRPDGAAFKTGDTLQLWLRPFETLMLEVSPAAKTVQALPPRAITSQQAAQLGILLPLKPSPLDDAMTLQFADAAKFEAQGLAKKVSAFETTLPALDGDQPILAVSVRLRKGDADWRHKPTVVQIVQALARVGDQNVQLIPVPDSRQHGNTQAAGASWVVFKVRLSQKWAHQPLKIALHSHLPDGVEADIETWVLKRWWQENTRPASDGYYTDAPS